MAANGLSDFIHRKFVTNDAREFAYSDLFAPPTRMSGAGAVPLYTVVGFQEPRNFDAMVAVTGLGGTRYTSPTAQPLVYDPRFTTSYLEDQGAYF
jgi:hypothetical protein